MSEIKLRAQCPYCGLWIKVINGELAHHEGGITEVKETPLKVWGVDEDKYQRHSQIVYSFKRTPRCEGSGKRIADHSARDATDAGSDAR